ncbi:endoglucanase 13-like [Pollicipes pollicipes]|uniref:endoglucanase 13-like n=1 Tax=Pollicipes pollicipes TaxID=41117 RepID=UPI0018854EB2|nr:endoglucanase 13-like [Pollicipes pollicipes]
MTNPCSVTIRSLLLILSATLAPPAAAADRQRSGVANYTTTWSVGASGKLTVVFLQTAARWTVRVKFSPAVTSMVTSVATAERQLATTYELTNKGYNAAQSAGSSLVIDFRVGFASAPVPQVVSVVTSGAELCSGGSTTATTTTTTTTAATTTTGSSSLPYNYAVVLRKSLLFYEAQRSGPLPADNRVLWRGDSALGDSGDDGEDLTGGYYDAGDHVKFGFPMAGMTTVLAWGALDFADGYAAAGQTGYVLDAIRWATDYFVKCHVAPTIFYGQVGNGSIDHDWWGRPEEMAMPRPAHKITASTPGSELAGETAAALAAASLVFRPSDLNYADTLLAHARQLYSFADTHRGEYHKSITDAENFYKSWSGYGDELAWAAAWLYRATQEASFLTRASGFSWDDKRAGAQVLLYQLTGDAQHGVLVNEFCDWLASGAPRTPQEQLFLQPWGSLRHTANAALICLEAAEAGLNPAQNRQLAKEQINLILGDAGRSYVVGFGFNPPLRPHHRASSCPDPPAVCGWPQLSSPDPNPQVLHGALVGGPDAKGEYQDVRSDYVKNEVATDYNSGFQSAVAGLLSLHVRGLYPAS